MDKNIKRPRKPSHIFNIPDHLLSKDYGFAHRAGYGTIIIAIAFIIDGYAEILIFAHFIKVVVVPLIHGIGSLPYVDKVIDKFKENSIREEGEMKQEKEEEEPVNS